MEIVDAGAGAPPPTPVVDGLFGHVHHNWGWALEKAMADMAAEAGREFKLCNKISEVPSRSVSVACL